MNKMAAMPIYCKNPAKSSFPEPAGRFPRKLVCSIGDFYSNDDPGLTLIYFTARSNFETWAFLPVKVQKVDFSETIAACDLKVG